MVLEKINSPDDVKNLSRDELAELSSEIRDTILRVVSSNGGHLSSNLGVVELTISLHRIFSSPKDKIIFDVGHQSYVHKLLTGRKDSFESLRKKDGASGFTKRDESEHDSFGSGHSSNAISAALGIATAMKLQGDDSHVVAVTGDGAFTGGMVYEALNNCTDKNLNLIIILNDNEMSISKNVGSVNNHFSKLRTSTRYLKFKQKFVMFFTKVPLLGNFIIRTSRSLKNWIKRRLLNENFFEQLGLVFFGPVRGNDSKRLEYLLKEAKRLKQICVIHVHTKKGMGYTFAEEQPDKYHSVGKFDIKTGVVPNGRENTYSYNMGRIICERAAENKKIVAVTAAMTDGTGLDGFARKYPDRFFDVGIAEEHAVTFCAGLAAQGMVPVFAVYSTFLQRSYDQIMEDVAIQGLPVVFAIDRAGIIGDDGVTHHGVFDVAMLSQIPGMTVLAPDSLKELEYCMDIALNSGTAVAVRYPKTCEVDYGLDEFINCGAYSYKDFGGGDVVIVTYGRITGNAVGAAEILNENGIGTRVVKLLAVSPLDLEGLLPVLKDAGTVLFAEEGIKQGGAGERLAVLLAEKGYIGDMLYKITAIDEKFVMHGDTDEILDELGLSKRGIAVSCLNAFKHEKN